MTESLLTVGELAKRLNQPLHRIEYLIKARKIRPASRAGHFRVFHESELAYLEGELRRLDRDRLPAA